MTPEHLSIIWDGERAPFAKAFIAAQRATEAVKKASTNPAFKSKYADLAGVVEAVVPALNAAGIGVLQFPAFDGEMVHLTTTLLHESGSSVTATLGMRPSKLDPQGVGSATTYARRYSLLAVTGAAPEDDDGNAASGPQQRRASPPDDAPAPGRLSSAEAKRRNLFQPMIDRIDGCDTITDLDELDRSFDDLTREHPVAWLEPYRNRMEGRREAIIARDVGGAEMDDEFRNVVGPGPSSVAGRQREVA